MMMSHTPPTGDMRAAMRDAVKRSKGNKKEARSAKTRWKEQAKQKRKLRSTIGLAVLGPLALLCLLYPLHSLGYFRLFSPGPLSKALSNPGQAETLNLASYHLTEVPPDINKLKELKELNLDANQIKKLGPELWELKKLQKLSINYNGFQELPVEIGSLQKLKVLKINGNELKSLPKELFELANLEVLSVKANKLDKLPEELGQLSKLETLELNGNQLSRLPSSISKLSRLEQLTISGNPLSEAPDFSGMKSLRRVSARGTGLSKAEIDVIKGQLGEKGSVTY